MDAEQTIGRLYMALANAQELNGNLLMVVGKLKSGDLLLEQVEVDGTTIQIKPVPMAKKESG